MILLDFIIILIPIILLHELAHFVAARIVKCDVTKLSIGFGKPIIYSKKIGNTVYQITPWLFGGYCSLKGELEDTKEEGAFANLKFTDKAILLCAGCYINIVTGAIALISNMLIPNSLVYLFGYYSIWVGACNLLPIPALDGGYLWLFWLEKFMTRAKAFKLIQSLVSWGFKIMMFLNIIFFIYLIVLAILYSL